MKVNPRGTDHNVRLIMLLFHSFLFWNNEAQCSIVILCIASLEILSRFFLWHQWCTTSYLFLLGTSSYLSDQKMSILAFFFLSSSYRTWIWCPRCWVWLWWLSSTTSPKLWRWWTSTDTRYVGVWAGEWGRGSLSVLVGLKKSNQLIPS